MKITHEVNGNNLEFKDTSNEEIVDIATINLPSGCGYIIIDQKSQDKLFYTTVYDFEKAFNVRFSSRLNIRELAAKALEKSQKDYENNKLQNYILQQAADRGKLVNNEQLRNLKWHLQMNVGGYAQDGSTGYICNIPQQKYYRFDLNRHRELKLFEKLREEMRDTKWCHCGYKDDDWEYVENYKGEKRGWMCPKCKRFKKLG